MEYRQESHERHGYESEADEYEGMRNYIQTLMGNSGPDEVIDMFVVLANVCDYRAMATLADKQTSGWYRMVELMCREAVKVLANVPNGPRPNIKLENAGLYWPDIEQSH
jgi:hypothetical protein